MKIYNFLLAGLFAANNDVRCPVEKALRLDCQTNSFDLELTDAIEENQACQEIRPDLHRVVFVSYKKELIVYSADNCQRRYRRNVSLLGRL